MARRLTPRRKRQLVDTLTGLKVKKLDPSSLQAPAIVFAPHPDDETLGCGGTILKKRRLDASVHVVFMTDGTLWPPTIPAHEIKRLREQEARAACRKLGVDQDSVTFLELADGRLIEQTSHAIERVIQVLVEHPVEQVFIPYYQDRDPTLDHVTTNQIVISALRRLGKKTTVYEFPVWYWRWWPRTRMPVRGCPGAWQSQPHSVLPNLWSLTDFGAHVGIDDVLDDKQMALNQHRSQLEGLHRIQSGAFIKWFFGRREIFYQHICP